MLYGGRVEKSNNNLDRTKTFTGKNGEEKSNAVSERITGCKHIGPFCGPPRLRQCKREKQNTSQRAGWEPALGHHCWVEVPEVWGSIPVFPLRHRGSFLLILHLIITLSDLELSRHSFSDNKPSTHPGQRHSSQ